MTDYNVTESAIALYSGGWRYRDIAQLCREYELDTLTANAICDVLYDLEGWE